MGRTTRGGREARPTHVRGFARPDPDRPEATATCPAHRSEGAIRWSCSVNGGRDCGRGRPARAVTTFVGPEWGKSFRSAPHSTPL